MEDYDAYLFDWDGTLGVTFPVWLQIVRKTLGRYGIEAADKEIVRKVFGAARSGLLELGVPEGDLAEIFAEWDKTAQAAMVSIALYPGAKEVVGALAGAGKKRALITATVRPTVEKALVVHEMQALFDVIITGDEVKAHKPDPESLLCALERLGVAKDRTVMLGDSEKDIRAAHNAGIDSILFFPPEHDVFHDLAELQTDNPTYTIRSWQELLERVQ